MVNYASFKGLATDLISQNGREVIFVALGTQTGEDWNPQFGPDVETTVTAVVTKFKTAEIDGTIIRKQDKKMLIDAVDYQTIVDAGGGLEQQRVKDGDQEYSIVDFEEIKPGPLGIMYKVQCRL